MYEDFDFFDDLDDSATLKKHRRTYLNDLWMAALDSDDIEKIHQVQNAVSLAWVRTQQQIRVYKDAPSQREHWQTEEWLARAVRAESVYEQMFRSLDRHRRLVTVQTAEQKAEKLEVDKLARLREHNEFLLRLEMLKARAKVAGMKCEIKRTQGRDGRFVHLIKSLGLLDGVDLDALWRQVDEMGPTGPEKRAREDLERWQKKLLEVKKKLQKGEGR